MSNGNIVRLRLEEKIRFLLMKYPMNLERVSQEASEYAGTFVSLDVVNRVLKKFKARQDKDTKYWLACSMAQELIHSSQSRQAKLEDMFSRWEGKEEVIVSSCCSYPVQKIEPMQGEPYYRCLKCDHTCNVVPKNKLELENLKLRIIRELRSESAFLISAAKTLGFTNLEREQPAPVNNNYVFVGRNETEDPKRKEVAIDSEMAKKADDMSAMEREKLIHKLEGMLSEPTPAEFEPETETGK